MASTYDSMSICTRTDRLFFQDTALQLWAPGAGRPPSPGHTTSACPGGQSVPGRALGQTNSHWTLIRCLVGARPSLSHFIS